MKKYIIILVAAFCSITAVAQQTTQKEEIYYNGSHVHIQPGDTVSIDSTQTRYLTGERMSSWVYKVNHIVKQAGGKRFPNGVLLKGINSWVIPAAVIPNGLVAEEIMQEMQKGHIIEEVIEQTIEPVQDTTPVQPQPVETTPKQVEPAPQPKPSTPHIPDTTQYEWGDEKMPEIKDVKHKCFNRISIGLRGGAASLMQQTTIDGKWHCGFDTWLDIQYAHYFGNRGSKKALHQPTMGILTGISVGYVQNKLSATIDSTYSVVADGNPIDYTIQATDVKENDGQIMVEIPIMFTMITDKGFFLNVGPKVSLPIFTHFKQNMQNANIHAYFPEMDVTVTNEQITGAVKNMDNQNKFNSTKLNVLVGIELGKEWNFKNNTSLGLGAYANYGVYSLYTNDLNKESFIAVTPPTAQGNAAVDILSLTDAYANKLGYFDGGVKLVYHFNFPKK